MKKMTCYRSVGGGGIHSIAPSRIAFTLAEVLITLGIIGVVAAITIPMLITKHQKMITVSRLKEAYSIISQAMLLAQRDHDEPKFWTLHSGSSISIREQATKDFCETYIVPYLTGAKVEGWKTVKDIGVTNGYVALNGKPIANGNLKASSHGYVIELNNQQILYYSYDNSSTGILEGMDVYVDINGKKGPNMFGKDAFLFYYNMSAGKIVPYSGGRDIETVKNTLCIKNAEWGSITCGLLIAEAGWQIKDDYPW